MSKDLAELTDALLAAARRAGAEAADALANEGHSLTVSVRRGALEQAEREEHVKLGLRVIMGRRQACVASSDTGAGAIAAMAERAVAMAREAPEDPVIGLADPDALARDWDLDALDLVDRSPEPAPQQLRDAALAAETAALSHKDIAQVEAATSACAYEGFHLAATNGFAGSYARSHHGLSCVAITGEGTGMERSWFGETHLHRADLPGPEAVGHKAALRTLARAGARRPKTGRFPVLYDERIAGSLIGALLAAVNGAAIARGASWLLDAMGTEVLPRGLSLIEDPTLPRRPASYPHDAEGLPTARRAIVENGVLQGWTLDLATARKLGLASTANADRGTSGPPYPSNHNVVLSQGADPPEALMRAMGTGVQVTSLFSPTINRNTGDYSAGASGLWIEAGTPAYPITEFTIAGNLREMLKSLVPANDARAHLARSVPSLLVEGLTIAGT